MNPNMKILIVDDDDEQVAGLILQRHEIADLFEHRGIKRVPVVPDGKLVGIISRANLLQALASAPIQSVVQAGDMTRSTRGSKPAPRSAVSTASSIASVAGQPE